MNRLMIKFDMLQIKRRTNTKIRIMSNHVHETRPEVDPLSMGVKNCFDYATLSIESNTDSGGDLRSCTFPISLCEF